MGKALLEIIREYDVADKAYRRFIRLETEDYPGRSSEQSLYENAPARLEGLALAFDVSRLSDAYSEQVILESWRKALAFDGSFIDIKLSEDGSTITFETNVDPGLNPHLQVDLTRDKQAVLASDIQKVFEEILTGKTQKLEELGMGLSELVLFLTYSGNFGNSLGFDSVFQNAINITYGSQYDESIEWLESQNTKDGLPHAVMEQVQLPIIKALLLAKMSNFLLLAEDTEPTQAQIDIKTALSLVANAEIRKALVAVLDNHTSEPALLQRVARAIEVVSEEDEISEITNDDLFAAEILENAFLTTTRILSDEKARSVLSQYEEIIDTSITTYIALALHRQSSSLHVSLLNRKNEVQNELSRNRKVNINKVEKITVVATLVSGLASLVGVSAHIYYVRQFIPDFVSPLELLVGTLVSGSIAVTGLKILNEGYAGKIVAFLERTFPSLPGATRNNALSYWKENINKRLEAFKEHGHKLTKTLDKLAASQLCRAALKNKERQRLLSPHPTEK